MSILQVNELESNSVSANVITAGQTTVVNSTGLYLNSTSGIINTSAIAVSNSSGNVVLQGTMNLASITINGTVYTSLRSETVNTQIFTSNGIWAKPVWANTGNELVVVHAWGGGGAGSTNSAVGYAGGGGAFVFGYFKSSMCNATCNVVVGLGGIAAANANPGSASIFYSNTTNSLAAYGGEGGNQTGIGGGNGGGWISNTGPLVGTRSTTGTDSTFGGGGGTNGSPFISGSSVYGGGGGGAAGQGSAGKSIYGGAGGGGATRSTSVYGGAGGLISSGVAPGGGGDFNYNGARGEVRIYTYRIVT